MNTPTKLLYGHKYHEKETKNTWQFFLYNRLGRQLLQHSVPKNMKESGQYTFWSKVADLYDILVEEKAAKAKIAALTQQRRREAKLTALENQFQALFSEIEQEEQSLNDYIGTQARCDFLGKIKRVILPV